MSVRVGNTLISPLVNSGSSGGGILTITMTPQQGGYDSFTWSGATTQQIADAFAAGTTIKLNYGSDGVYDVDQLRTFTSGANINVIATYLADYDTTIETQLFYDGTGEQFDTDFYTDSQVDNLLAAKQDTLTAGTGISINNNVISASGGETMLVTLTKTTIGQYSNVWVWSSDYTFAQLTANPDAIRVFVDNWRYESEGNIKPTYTKVETFEQSTKITLVRDLAGVEMSFILNQPRELEGQTVNPAIFDVTNFVDENKTLLTILPTLTLADNATYIPDGTTITLQTPSSDKEMYGEIGSSDYYPHRDIITGNFMILPVRRKVGSGESYWVEEECLIMSVTRRGEPSVADSYIYKTFMFNGEYYKMTLTNSSYPNEVYTITKIPGGQAYTAGTGVSH